MGSIKIGTVIAARRKEKGVTQEELAQHVGVSKPAVSKWESGQSYPDISLLPLLAAYFNISVDELISYEPQMNLEDIRKLYRRFADAFVKEPFDQVYEKIEAYVKKYFSCWQLQIQMGLLMINHLNLAGSPERIEQLTKETLEMFKRVSKSCEDVNLAKEALQYEALCHLLLKDPVSAIDILENMSNPMVSPESLLIQAYQMKGDQKKAIEYLQGYVYMNLMSVIGAGSDFCAMYADQPERMDIYYHKFLELAKVFEVDKIQPAALIKVHLNAAAVYVMQDKKEKAMDALESYLDNINNMDKSGLFLKENQYFDALNGYFASNNLETAAPRNTEIIWKDFKNVVIANPLFAPLETEERYQKLKKRFEFEL